MKLSLISPAFPFSGRVPIVPPILEYMAALTRKADPNVEIELLDANVSELSAEDVNADLVGISAMTATVPWVYSFADRLRARGVRVVLGGIHPTALPDEAAMHADSVIVGEAESVWTETLEDARFGRLKSRYIGQRLPLDDLPIPVRNMLDPKPYKFRAVFTARGCPFRCTFCSVRRFFGDTIRYRTVDKVVEEVRTIPDGVYFNGDDNIWGGSPERAIELFTRLSAEALKPWYGFGDLRAPQGPKGDKLLEAASKSGLFSVWAGWETSSVEGLGAYNAGAKQGKNREDAVKKIKDFGIDVVLFAILGGRGDTRRDFEDVLRLADRLKVGVHPVLLTPLPGTELYDEYTPYLIPGRGWEYYTGVSAVFEHPTMSAEEREGMYFRTSLELLSMKRIFRHLFEIPAKGFPVTHMLSLMMALPVRRAMKKAYYEWNRRTETEGTLRQAARAGKKV